jgi:predicted PurR-regulated permease PerM
MPEKKITFDSFIRGIISGAIVIGLLYLVNYLSGVLLPFFVAWLIAYMINPIDEATVIADVKALREAGAQYIIAYSH